MYQNNSAYLMTGTDGLDPLFCDLNKVLVIGGKMILFWLHLIK